MSFTQSKTASVSREDDGSFDNDDLKELSTWINENYIIGEEIKIISDQDDDGETLRIIIE